MNAEDVANKLTFWIKSKIRAAQAKGVVIGLSGGIDSSVLAALCKRASPEALLGLIMPCHSNPEDEMYARMVVDKFNIPVKKVMLDGVFDAYLGTVEEQNVTASVDNLCVANLKPRLRMATLYFFANKLRYLVAGSGDRSEIVVGYFTKYGDGAADIFPLGNLLKTELKALGAYLGVPQPIIDKPSSAGLWPGQVSEGELGITYGEIDGYIKTGEAAPAVKKRIEQLIAASEHKRHLPPVPEF